MPIFYLCTVTLVLPSFNILFYFILLQKRILLWVNLLTKVDNGDITYQTSTYSFHWKILMLKGCYMLFSSLRLFHGPFIDINEFFLVFAKETICDAKLWVEEKCCQNQQSTPNSANPHEMSISPPTLPSPSRNWHIFTGRNEVVAKVMFLLMSVILFTGRVCLSACWDTTSPGSTPPLGSTRPLGSMHPLGSRLRHTVNERPVRILLEYTLV